MRITKKRKHNGRKGTNMLADSPPPFMMTRCSQSDCSETPSHLGWKPAVRCHCPASVASSAPQLATSNNPAAVKWQYYLLPPQVKQ
ncbi:hypothetical protein GN956_G5314 [Arapaima gigas]